MQFTIQVTTAAEATLAAELMDFAAERMQADAAPDATRRTRRRRGGDDTAPAVAAPPVAQPVAAPPVAAPPVAAPPAAAPPVAAPPVAAPPVAQPAVAAPPVTAPPVTAPPVAQPAVAAPLTPAAAADALDGLATLREETRKVVQQAGIGPWFSAVITALPEDDRRITTMSADALRNLKAAAEAQIAATAQAASTLG